MAGCSYAFAAQTGALTGRVLDATAEEPVEGVLVIVLSGDAARGSSLTGADGRFAFQSLPAGSYRIQAARVGYSPWAGPIRVATGAPAFVEIRLQRQPLVEELEVHPEASPEPTPYKGLSREDSRELAGTLGDPIRGLTSIPGVAGINDFKSEIRIRGGDTEDTVFRLDGVTMENPYHFPWARGSIAALNPDAFDRLIVLTSGIDAGIGDTVSGAVVMSPSERGSKAQFLDLSAGTLLSSLTGGGSLSEEGSWIVSGRYSNLAIYKSIYDVKTVDVPSFGDLFVRVRQPVFQGADFVAGALGIVNNLSTTNPEEHRSSYMDARAGMGYAGLDAPLPGGGRLSTRLSWSGARRTVSSTEGDDLRSWEERTRVSADVSSAPAMVRVRGGIEGSYFNGNIVGQLHTAGPLQALDETSGRAGAYGVFTVEPPGGWTLEAGLRADWDSLEGWAPVSPRLSLSRDFARGRWRISATRTAQFPRLSQKFLDQGEPLAPTYSHEIASEFLIRLPRGIELETGVFYRRLWDMTHELVNRYPDLPEPVGRFGGGETRGFEMALRKDTGRFRARGALTLLDATATRGGVEYDRNSDQPYRLDASAVYLLNERWSVSSRFQAAAGLPFSSFEPLENGQRYLGPLNGRRLPATARLDARISREWSLRGARARLFLEMDNILDRVNSRGRDYRWDEDSRQYIFHDEESMPLLPGIGFEMSWGGR